MDLNYINRMDVESEKTVVHIGHQGVRKSLQLTMMKLLASGQNHQNDFVQEPIKTELTAADLERLEAARLKREAKQAKRIK